MPEEEQAWFPKEEVLSYEEMLRVLRVGAGLGIRKVRVTGGEPLTRPGVADFCAAVAAVPGIEDIGVSTNGTLLSKAEGGSTLAEKLVKAGVRSVNISLDSLDRAAYQRTTGRDLLPKVLEGIDAALAAGFPSLKLNCVLMKHQSEAELLPLMAYAAEKGVLLRFIELMPVSTQEVLSEDNFLPVATAKRLSVVRFHGRNRATWETKTKSAAERFDYLYTKDELSEWVDRIAELSGEADEVHVIMNNCHEDKAVHNARDIGELLRDQGLPVAALTAPASPPS